MTEIKCKYCKQIGDSSQFKEYTTETNEGICDYCLDELYLVAQDIEECN